MYWLTMIKRLVLFCCLCLPALAVSAQEQEVKFAFDNYHRYYREARLCTDSAKLEAMKKLRVYFHEHPYRLSKAVSYTHLRAHETGRNLVCRLLLEKKKKKNNKYKKK